MAYCTNCGAWIDDNAQFCTNCGSASANNPAAPNMQANGAGAADPQDVSQNKGKAALAYLGILILIPLLTAKDSAFAKFHVNQGLILLIGSFAVEVLSRVFNAVDITSLTILTSVLAAALFVLRIVGFVWALQGKQKELPVIGSFRIIQ